MTSLTNQDSRHESGYGPGAPNLNSYVPRIKASHGRTMEEKPPPLQCRMPTGVYLSGLSLPVTEVTVNWERSCEGWWFNDRKRHVTALYCEEELSRTRFVACTYKRLIRTHRSECMLLSHNWAISPSCSDHTIGVRVNPAQALLRFWRPARACPGTQLTTQRLSGT